MEIKRNIFDSSARMPASYELVASAMAPGDSGTTVLPRDPRQINSDVRHARSPRIGEK